LLSSWTVITWIVVFGSSIVMLLWILVYSFFFSSDFVDEVIILFGTISFWATVIFSVGVALGVYYAISFLSKLTTVLQLLASSLNSFRRPTSRLTSKSFEKCGSRATSKTNLVSATEMARRTEKAAAVAAHHTWKPRPCSTSLIIAPVPKSL